MRLTVLSDNCAGAGFLAEHGLSYRIESEGETILFDTGHSDVFLRNATKLGIDLQRDINTIVLSHGHWDHGDGLSYLKDKTLITHPEAFMKRFRKTDNSYIGLKLTNQELKERYNLITSRAPYTISSNIIFLGEIPRQCDFESNTTAFIDENNEPDFIPDDSALLVIEDDQLIIISGCAHSGICNIIQYAQAFTGIKKVKAVFGGFHLKANNKQTKETIQFMKNNAIKQVFPSHCTEQDAICAFNKELKTMQVKTGQIVKI